MGGEGVEGVKREERRGEQIRRGGESREEERRGTEWR